MMLKCGILYRQTARVIPTDKTGNRQLLFVKVKKMIENKNCHSKLNGSFL